MFRYFEDFGPSHYLCTSISYSEHLVQWSSPQNRHQDGYQKYSLPARSSDIHCEFVTGGQQKNNPNWYAYYGTAFWYGHKNKWNQVEIRQIKMTILMAKQDFNLSFMWWTWSKIQHCCKCAPEVLNIWKSFYWPFGQTFWEENERTWRGWISLGARVTLQKSRVWMYVIIRLEPKGKIKPQNLLPSLKVKKEAKIPKAACHR